jgi:AbrB family looped-hinge helix DNA binding protein
MSEQLVPIDRAGRVILPKPIRDELALDAGDMLKVRVEGKTVTLSPCKQMSGLIRKGKALVFSAGGNKTINREAVAVVTAEERDRRANEFIVKATAAGRKVRA